MPRLNPSSMSAAPIDRAPWPRYLSIVTLHSSRSPMPTREELNDLLEAVAARADRQAFAALFKHFAPRVKTYLMRGGSPEAAAEELTQECMISVWRKAALFDARQAAASTWIFTIARNLRIDQLRRKSPTVTWVDEPDAAPLDAPDPSPAPEELMDGLRLCHRMNEALARLPHEQAQVLRLSFYEDQPHVAIARELGIPLGTVKSRVRLAIGHLRRLLHGFES